MVHNMVDFAIFRSSSIRVVKKATYGLRTKIVSCGWWEGYIVWSLCTRHAGLLMVHYHMAWFFIGGILYWDYSGDSHILQFIVIWGIALWGNQLNFTAPDIAHSAERWYTPVRTIWVPAWYMAMHSIPPPIKVQVPHLPSGLEPRNLLNA